MKELHLTKKDFRIEWFGGTGGGGQYRNKHRNCCRIKHLETGMVETGQSHRERPANQKEAFNKLAKRLIAYYCINDPDREISEERIRNYHAVRNEVLDHASGLRQSYKHVVQNRNLDDMIEARRIAMTSSEE